MRQIKLSAILVLLTLHRVSYGQASFAQANLDELQRIAEKKSAEEESITLSDLGILMSFVGVPAGPLEKLDHLAIKIPTVIDVPAYLGTGFGIKGSVLFSGKEVDITVYVIKRPSGEKGFSVMLGLPSNWRMSDLDPSLAKLDELSLPSGRFVVASFEYREPTFNIKIKKGLNFISGLNLSGPLEALGALINQKGNFGGALVLKGGDIVFQGVIPRDIKQSQFGAAIPLKIGVDFTKIEKMPPDITKFIHQINLDNISFYVTPPPTPTFGLRGGISVQLGTQPEPLIFSASSIVAPNSMAFAGELEGIIQLYWLGLGNGGMQLDVDIPIVSSLAAIGVPLPFSGISMRGTALIGKKGPHQATINLAGGFKLKSDGVPTDFVFEGEGVNLHLSELILWLAEQIKAPLEREKVPDITIKNAKVYVVPPPNAVRIADKLYEPGLIIQGHGNIERVGMEIDLRIDPIANVAQGVAYLAPIVTKHITFTGSGRDNKAGTQDDGAYLDITVPVTNPANMQFAGSGLLEIPAMDIKQGIDFVLKPTVIDTNFISEVGGQYSMKVALVLPVASPEKFEAGFSFQQDFIDYFYAYIKKELPNVMAKINRSIKDINQALEKAHTTVARQPNVLKQKTEAEDQKIRNKIATIEQAIAEHKRKCEAQKIKLTKDCIAIATKEVEKFGLLQSLKGLQVGSQAGEKALDVAQAITKTVHNLQEEKKVLDGAASVFNGMVAALNEGIRIFQIKKVAGSTSGQELSQGKLPRLDIFELIVALPQQPQKKLVLRDLQFDFKQPQNSMRTILEQIMKNLMGGKV